MLEALAHQVLDAGATGLVALGTTGEPATLTPAERGSVMDVAARVCRERQAPLLAGATPLKTSMPWRGPEVSAALSVVPPFARAGARPACSPISPSSPPAAPYHSSSTTSRTGPAST